MFINTRNEAKIAQKIARAFGWERNQAYFYKSYTTNLFPGYQNDSETRTMVARINAAIRANRVK